MALLYSPSPGLCQEPRAPASDATCRRRTISVVPEEPESPLSVVTPAMEFCEERDSPNKGGAA